mgnify:CR=1 FL=1
MKGYFSLKYDCYTDELFFGNLNKDVGGIGFLNDYKKGGMLDRLVAHDVVEHSVSHRTKTYVTYESEIRALGAIEITRPNEFLDLFNDVLWQLEYLNRDLKPVPYIIGKFLLDDYHVSTDLMKYLISEGIKPSNARNAAYHFAWGNYQKYCQFGGCTYSAQQAFYFISRNVSQLVDALRFEEGYFTGISVYFDTQKQIIRHQYIRRE